MGKLRIRVVGPEDDKKEFLNNFSNENIIFLTELDQNSVNLDYVIYLNEPVSDIYLKICEEQNVGILLSSKRPWKDYLATINIGGYLLYLEIPDNHIVRDDIFLLKDKNMAYFLEKEYHHYRLASIADKPNINGYMYLKQEINNALMDENIQKEIKQNTLNVEFSLSSDKEYYERTQIDPTRCIGNVIAVGSFFLFIKENCNYSIMNMPISDSKCFAFMRYKCNIGRMEDIDKIVTDMKITTWDIWLSTALSEDYIRDVLCIN